MVRLKVYVLSQNQIILRTDHIQFSVEELLVGSVVGFRRGKRGGIDLIRVKRFFDYLAESAFFISEDVCTKTPVEFSLVVYETEVSLFIISWQQTISDPRIIKGCLQQLLQRFIVGFWHETRSPECEAFCFVIRHFPLRRSFKKSQRHRSLFQDGLQELDSVATSLLDFRFERLAGPHQRLDSFYNDGLFGEGWER